MKKFLLLLILAVAGLQPVSAQSYRGFADIEAGYIVDCDSAFIGLTTTHGVQLAEKFFIGVGIGVLGDTKQFAMPIYGDFRFDWWTDNKLSPFIDMKAGYTLKLNPQYYSIGSGLYLNPTIGFRIRLNNRNGINIGLSYSRLKFNYNDVHVYKNAIAIKAGIDF